MNERQAFLKAIPEDPAEANRLTSSATVLSPFSAARATWALNAAVCLFRLPAVAPPLDSPVA